MAIDENLGSILNLSRSNICLVSDATQIHYRSELKKHDLPERLGHLSVDIDPSFQPLKSLLVNPFDTVNFAMVTFEYDADRSGKAVRDLQREKLRGLGYQLVVSNVNYHAKCPYKDWWVPPRLVPEERWSPFLVTM